MEPTLFQLEGSSDASVYAPAPATVPSPRTLNDHPLAFVDVETTGASTAYGHRIIEIRVLRVERGQVVGEYSRLLDPGRPISRGVVALTGITQEMVTGQPTFRDVLPELRPLIGDAIVVGHNVRFDLSFLAGEFRAAGAALTSALCDPCHVLDTVRIARRRFGRGGNALQSLAPRLGVVPTVAHRALADCQTTFGVLREMLAPVGGWGITIDDAIGQQGGPIRIPSPHQSILPLELEEALHQRKPVELEYVDADEQRTRRVVEPQTIRRRGDELVMIAHCQLRQARRSFKLDRIVQLWPVPPASSISPAVAADC